MGQHRARVPRGVGVMACLLLLACGGPTGPSADLGETFVLAPGESVRIEGTAVTLRFAGVLGDSRCPADAVCIQGGDAIVRIELQSGAGAAEPRDLHTGSLAPVRYQDLTVTLVLLEPYPFSASPIAPDDYRASLRVTR
jgi:hypothetical protein